MVRSSVVLLLIYASLGQDLSQDVVYIEGALPVVLSAPHGGLDFPADIADRTAGCLVNGACVFSHSICLTPDATNCPVVTTTDRNTKELMFEVAAALTRIGKGKQPHLIFTNLHRSKLDANRDLDEAAEGEPRAVTAWQAYQNSLDTATAAVAREFGAGLFLEVHGQGHVEQWIEWGYELSANQLNGNISQLASKSSFARLAATSASQTAFTDLIRGPASFGGKAQNRGYLSVPSPAHPGPGLGNYFSGGFNTETRGSLNGGLVDSVQMEVSANIRNDGNASLRLNFATDLAVMIDEFMLEQYNLQLNGAHSSTSGVWVSFLLCALCFCMLDTSPAD